MSKTTIYIADDHRIVSEGIASFLIGNNDFKIIGSFISGKELFNTLKIKQSDILLLDINMPGMSGFQIAKIIKKEYPHTKIIFISSNTDKNNIDEAVKSGGVGYLSKDIDEDEFIFGLNKIKNGDTFYSKGIQQAVFNSYTNIIKSDTENSDSELSKREFEIIKLFAEGLSYKEIGEQLFISNRTVETHKKHILNKLKLKTTIDLVKYAILNGIVSI